MSGGFTFLLVLLMLPTAPAFYPIGSARPTRPSMTLAISDAVEIVTFVFDVEGKARRLEERRNVMPFSGRVVPTRRPKTMPYDHGFATPISAKAFGLKYATAAADALAATRMRTIEVASLLGILAKTSLLWKIDIVVMFAQKLAAFIATFRPFALIDLGDEHWPRCHGSLCDGIAGTVRV